MIAIFLLVVFIKVSIHYNNPPLLAGAFTFATAVLNLAFYGDLALVITSAFVTMALMWLYFWLLDRFVESAVWWLIMLGFPVAFFILSSAMHEQFAYNASAI